AGALVVRDVEDLIHPRMEGVRLEYLDDLVDEREYHIVYVGMERTVALAIEAVCVGPDVLLRHLDVRRLIELRIDLDQLAERRGARRMPELVELRDDPNSRFACGGFDSLDVVPGQRILFA